MECKWHQIKDWAESYFEGHSVSVHLFVQCTNLLVLQECLTHAGAEVQLSLQLADLLLPVA